MAKTAEVSIAAPTVRPLEGIRRLDRTLGIVMLAPALVYITLLVALPFLLAVVLSFTSASAVTSWAVSMAASLTCPASCTGPRRGTGCASRSRSGP